MSNVVCIFLKYVWMKKYMKMCVILFKNWKYIAKIFYQTGPKVCLSLVAGSGCLPFFHCSIFISHPPLFVGSTLNFHKVGVVETEKEFFFLAKMQNWLSNFHRFSFQSFNFKFCQFSPLTFNFCQFLRLRYCRCYCCH